MRSLVSRGKTNNHDLSLVLTVSDIKMCRTRHIHILYTIYIFRSSPPSTRLIGKVVLRSLWDGHLHIVRERATILVSFQSSERVKHLKIFCFRVDRSQRSRELDIARGDYDWLCSNVVIIRNKWRAGARDGQRHGNSWWREGSGDYRYTAHWFRKNNHHRYEDVYDPAHEWGFMYHHLLSSE